MYYTKFIVLNYTLPFLCEHQLEQITSSLPMISLQLCFNDTTGSSTIRRYRFGEISVALLEEVFRAGSGL